MNEHCPRCDAETTPEAKFCARCGLSLTGLHGKAVAGQTRHPSPLAVPDEYELIGGAVDLYFRTESAWGGKRLSGRESIGVVLLNTGYPLCGVTIKVRGEDQAGKELFAIERTADDLPRGEPVTVEVPSYEITAEPARLVVLLVSAAFSPIDIE